MNFLMKTYLRLSSIVCFVLITGYSRQAPAVQVTFQVNMSAQTLLGAFDPINDSVVVAGDPINNWSTTAAPLTPSTSDTNIWVGTYDVGGIAGGTAQYKYVVISAAPPIWESTVGTGGGTGNRTFTIPSTDEALPVVYFNNVTNSTSVTNQITFQVDMSVQIGLGKFDPSSGTVYIAGEFNSWNATANPMTNSLTDTNIWFTTMSLTGAEASTVDYKYIMNGTWEGNVGACGSQNRSVTLAMTNQTLAAVYFDNLASVPVPTPLVFQVDLAVQTALGNFNPATDLVEARGTFNNWTGGFALTNSTDSPYLFSGTWVDNNDAVGSAISYQYVLNGGTWETAVGNRMYSITSTNEQTLPLVFFNNVSNLGPISIHVAAGQVTLGWTAGPLIRLQSAAGLVTTPWQDVPNTQGSNSITVPINSGQLYFRLTGP